MIRLFIILTVFIVACSDAKTEKRSSDRDKIDSDCDKVVQLIAQGDSQKAMQHLKSISVMSPSDLDSLAITINSQMASLLPSYGRLTGYEFVKEFSAKDILVRRNYLLKFERYYLRCSFTIYKTVGGWKVTNFDYDDSLIEVLY